MAKGSRIVIRLDESLRVQLHNKASELGLDDAAYARMILHQAMNGAAHGVVQSPARDVRADSSGLGSRDRIGNLPPIEPDELEELDPPVEEMDIPADEDPDPATLQDLMTEGTPLLDQMLQQMAQPAMPKVPMRSAGYRSRSRGPAPAVMGPGSKTRAIGLNEQIIGGNQFGDARGNVLRENMRHFIGGTGRR